MPDLSAPTQAVLEELRPILVSLAKDTIAAAVRQTPSAHVELGTVQDVDHLRGIAAVVLDSRSLADSVPLEADIASIHPGVGDRVWVEITPPHGPRVIGRARGIPRLLGFVLVETGATIGAGATDLASVDVVSQPNRLLEITCHVGNLENPVGSTDVAIWVEDSSGNVIGWAAKSSVADAPHGSVLYVAAGGPVRLTMRGAAFPGTVDMVAEPIGTAPGPAWMKVEDIGSAVG